jgi:hypothetical protein
MASMSDELISIIAGGLAVLLVAVIFLIIRESGRKKKQKEKGLPEAEREIRKGILEKFHLYSKDFGGVIAEIEADGWTSKSVSFAKIFAGRERLTEMEVGEMRSFPSLNTGMGMATPTILLSVLAKFFGSKYSEIELSRKTPSGPPDKAEFYFDLKNMARYLNSYAKYLENKRAG